MNYWTVAADTSMISARHLILQLLMIADLLDDREVVKDETIEVLRPQVEDRPLLRHFAALTNGCRTLRATAILMIIMRYYLF